MKKAVLFTLMMGLMLTLCSCQSSKDSADEMFDEYSRRIEENVRQADKLTRDMQEVGNILHDIRNGK